MRAQGKGGKAHEACGSSASSGGIFGSLLFTGMRGHEEPGEKGGMRRPCREKDDTGERIDLCVVASRERGRKDRATAEGAAGENERGRKKGEECRGLESWDEEERACGASALRGRIEIVRERGDKKAARARRRNVGADKSGLVRAGGTSMARHQPEKYGSDDRRAADVRGETSAKSRFRRKG